jgi:outer membrane receptor protein involved in Fe transport
MRLNLTSSNQDKRSSRCGCSLDRKAQPGFKDDSGSLTSPKWNATATFGYDVDQYSVNWVTRYYGKTNYTNGFGTFWKTGVEVDDATIQSQTVHNLVLSYRGETKSGGSWVASFNVNNLFDRDPPITASQNLRGGQQAVSNVYDVFGRRYQVSMNYNF